MTQLPPDDRQWQEFLRKHRPMPPPTDADLEEQLMEAVEQSSHSGIAHSLRVWPPALVAGLLMVLGSYRLLIPAPEPANAIQVEAFLQDNWNQVVGDTPPHSHNNPVVQVDWRLEANAAH